MPRPSSATDTKASALCPFLFNLHQVEYRQKTSIHYLIIKVQTAWCKPSRPCAFYTDENFIKYSYAFSAWTNILPQFFYLVNWTTGWKKKNFHPAARNAAAVRPSLLWSIASRMVQYTGV
jgi:hypothetical protein